MVLCILALGHKIVPIDSSRPCVGREVRTGRMIIRPLFPGQGTAHPIGHCLCITRRRHGSKACILDSAIPCGHHYRFCLEHISIRTIRRKPDRADDTLPLSDQVCHSEAIDDLHASLLSDLPGAPLLSRADEPKADRRWNTAFTSPSKPFLSRCIFARLIGQRHREDDNISIRIIAIALITP